MKIIFFGSPKSAIPILEKISNSRHQLVAVVTQNAKPKGREKKLTKTDIAQYCIEKKIKIFESNNISDLFENELKNLETSFGVTLTSAISVCSISLESNCFLIISLKSSFN